MRLSRIIIKNFRRIKTADISLEPASFLIGQNNHGKSSVIRAVEILLGQASPTAQDFYQSGGVYSAELEVIGYFSGVSPEVAVARGFRGRVVNGEYCYKRTFSYSAPAKPKIECVEYPYTIKGEFSTAKTGQDLIDAGLDQAVLQEASMDPTKKLGKEWERDLLDYVVDFDTTLPPAWKPNPGGIPGNVLSRLPRLMHVPAITDQNDISQADRNTTIAEVLGLLFEDLLADNVVAAALEENLQLLEKQMSPEDEGSLISGLCKDVNSIIGSVFPGCGIRIKPSLQQLTDILKPKYAVSMFSNVSTDASRQGTGLLRTTIFSMLRYHAHLRATKDIQTRPLLVAFEEPELYLHPSAANLLRDTIYALGRSDQIICTTHSPWMIDLSRELQSLTKMVGQEDGSVTSINYGVSQQVLGLDIDDQARVKMLQLFDDEMSRVFFSDRVVVVEGDSELLAIKRTMSVVPEDDRKRLLATNQVIRARGKAAILSVVKYLKALSIDPVVMHDRDRGTEHAERLNPLIEAAVGDQSKLVVLEECLENALGYEPPSSDKPFKAYQRASSWSTIDDIPNAWLTAFGKAFNWQPPA